MRTNPEATTRRRKKNKNGAGARSLAPPFFSKTTREGQRERLRSGKTVAAAGKEESIDDDANVCARAKEREGPPFSSFSVSPWPRRRRVFLAPRRDGDGKKEFVV